MELEAKTGKKAVTATNAKPALQEKSPKELKPKSKNNHTLKNLS